MCRNSTTAQIKVELSSQSPLLTLPSRKSECAPVTTIALGQAETTWSGRVKEIFSHTLKVSLTSGNED